jgi:PAS domain-containing protein
MKAEQSLATHDKMMEALFSAIPNPIFYLDNSACLLGCNAAFETMVRKSAGDLHGASFYEMVPSSASQELHEKHLELLKKGGQLVYECALPNMVRTTRY